MTLNFAREQVASFISPTAKYGDQLYAYGDSGEVVLRAIDGLLTRRDVFDLAETTAFARQFIAIILANKEVDLVTTSIATTSGRIAFEQIMHLIGPQTNTFKALCNDRNAFFEFFSALFEHVKRFDVEFNHAQGGVALELITEYTVYFFPDDEKVMFGHPVIGGSLFRNAQSPKPNSSGLFGDGDVDIPGPPPPIYDGDSGLQGAAFVNFFQCAVTSLTSLRRWPTSLQLIVLRFIIKQFYVFLLTRTVNEYDQRNKVRVLNDPPMVEEMQDFCDAVLERWPMDATYRNVLDVWVGFTRPWRYSVTYGTLQGVDLREFAGFIGHCRPAILYPCQTLLSRFEKVDFCNVHVAASLVYIIELLEKPLMDEVFDLLNCNVDNLLNKLKTFAVTGLNAAKRRDAYLEARSEATGWRRFLWDSTINDRRKLEEAMGYYNKVVLSADVDAPAPVDFDDSQLPAVEEEDAQHEPDFQVDPATGFKTLTPLGRKQVILGKRRFNFSEVVKTRPRIMAPAAWYENETATRVVYRFCEFLNTLPTTQKLASAYGQWTLLGFLAYILMEPPYPRGNIPAFATNISRRAASPNIRFMASYPFLLLCFFFILRLLFVVLF
uniref:ELMO domain-containing protein n=1 Tax=Steinernema glaseri TaxID=37863 RepID=A0A1I7ZN71_9BILA